MAPAEERNGRLDIEDHVICVTLLLSHDLALQVLPTVSVAVFTYLNRLAIQARADLQRLGVLDDLAAHNPRAVRRPAVEALAQGPLAAAALDLPVAVGDVVPDGVAQDVVQGLRLGDVGAGLADDGDELAFVVEAFRHLGLPMHGDGIRGARQRGDWLVLRRARHYISFF